MQTNIFKQEKISPLPFTQITRASLVLIGAEIQNAQCLHIITGKYRNIGLKNSR